MTSRSATASTQRSLKNKTGEEFNLVLHNNALPMWVYDTGTLRFLDANLAAVKLYGYSRAEFLKMRLSDIVDDNHAADKKAATQTRQRKSATTTHCAKNGSRIHVQTSSKRIAYNGHRATLVEIKEVLNKTQTDQYFRTLLDDTPDSIVVIDGRGKIILVNKQTEKLFGYTRDELLGKAMETLVPQKLRSAHRRHRRDYSEKPRVRQMGAGLELRGLAKGGSEIPVEISLSPVQTENGLLVMAAIRDITAQQQAKAALREAETKYRALIEKLPMIVYTNLASDISLTRYVSPQVENILGYTPEEWLKDPKFWQKTLHPEDQRRVLDEVARIERTGEPFDMEYRVIARDGRVVWFRDQAVLPADSDGQGSYWQGIMTDITDRKQAVEALGRSEAMYRGLFESVLDGIFRTTPDGRILSASPALVHMLGYESEDDLLSINVGELYSDPQVRERTQRILKKTGELRNVEIELKRGDGRPLAVLENSRAVRDSKGTVIFYEGTLTDITERKHAEEALRSSEGELRAVFEAIPDLVLVLDKDGRYLKIAPTNPNSMPFPPEITPGKVVHDIFSRPKADEFVGYIRKALRTKKPVHFEYAQLIDNRVMWFAGTTAPLTQDTVVWVARDITSQKLAEEQDRRRLTELETLYESGLALSQTLDPRQIGQKIIKVLSERLDLHHAAVRVRREDQDGVELLAFSDMKDEAGPNEAAATRARDAITKIGQGMAGWVIEHGLLINSGNLPLDPRYVETFPHMLSGLYVPIKTGRRVLGCISVEIDQHDAFKEADELLLITLASQAAAALENARLFAETQKRAAESNALYEATRDLTAQTDLSTLLQTLAERVATLLNIPGGGVYLYDTENDQLEIVSATQASLPIGTRLQMGEGMAGRVAQTREPLIVEDYQNWEGRSAQYADQPFEAVLEVPMLYRGELIGVIAAYHIHREISPAGKEKSGFTQEDLRLVSLFAASAAGAIYSARLFDAERLRRQDAERLRQIAVHSAERLSVLHGATQEITGISQDPEQVYASIHQAASRLMPTEAFAITLIDEQHYEIDGVYLFDKNGRSPSMNVPLGQGFFSRVIYSGETLLINDLEKEDVQAVHFGSQEHVRSVLAAPLRAGGHVIGALSAQSYEADAYNEEDQVLLEMLAAQAAIAIQNARLYQAALRSAERQAVLHGISQEMARLNQEPEQLYAAIHDAAAQLVPAEVFYIALINEAENQMEGVYAIDRGQRESVVRFPLGSGYSGWVVENRRTLLIQDARLPNGIEPVNFPEDSETLSVLVVPLRLGEKVIGAMSVQSYRENQFTEEDQAIFEMLGSQVAVALENARLFDQTSRRLNELEALTKAGETLTGTLELNPLLENILRAARQAIPAAEKGTIMLREQNEWSRAHLDEQTGKHHLHVRAQVGYDDAHMLELPFDDTKGYAGRAFHEKRPILTHDCLAEFEMPFDHKLEEVNTVQSAIVAPLIVKGDAIGSISLDNASRKAAFDEEDLRLLVLFASSAAVVIENARLFSETRQRADEFEMLYATTLDIGANQQDPSSLLPILVERAVKLLGTYGGGIYLYDAVRNELELTVSIPHQNGLGVRQSLGEGAAGLVAQTRTPLVIDDYETWEGRRASLEGAPFRALVQVPMIYGGDLIGVLDVYEYGDSTRKFSEADAKLLSLFAAHAAGVIHSMRLYDEARKTAAKFTDLYEMAHDLSGQHNLDDLLNLIVERAGSLLNAPISGIYLYDEARNDLYVAVNRGLATSLGIRLAMGEGAAGRVAQSRLPVIIDDHQTWEGRSPQYEGVPLRSILEVPMLYGGQLIGVLTVDEIGDSDRVFTQEDASLLSLFASQAAAVVYSARLFEKVSQRAGEFQALYQTAADLSSQSDLPTLLNTIIQRAWVLTRASGASFYLFDIERGDLELVAIHDPQIQPGVRLELGEGVAGKVAQTRQPLLVNDYQTWEGRSSKYEGIAHTSVVAVPMLYSGELLGVLNVFTQADQNVGDPQHQLGEQDINLIALFANAAAGAVYGARLLDQTRRRVEELDAIARVSSALRTATTRVEMAPIILAQLREVLHADGAAFLRLNPVTGEINNELSHGSLEHLNGRIIPVGKGLSAKVLESRRPYSTPNLHDDPQLFMSELLPVVRSAIIVPLVSQNIALGVLWVTRDEKEGVQPPPFDQRDLRILSAIADITANAIHRVSLYEQTTHYAEQLVTVNAMGHALSETLDLPGIYEKAARSALELLPDTCVVTIFLIDPQANLITAQYGLWEGELIDVTARPALHYDEPGNQGKVILSAKPLIVPDLDESPEFQLKKGNDTRRTRSALYIPMKAEGRVIGVLQLESYTKNRYDANDAELLELAANTTASAIQNTRLFSQLKRRVDQLSALHSVDTAIGSTTDLRVSLQAVLENITRQLRVDAADVLLLNSSSLILQYGAGVGFLTTEAMRTSTSIGRGQAGKAALERRAVYIPDLNAENSGFRRTNLVAAERFVAYFVLPLVAKGEVKGVLEIFHRESLDMDEERRSFLDMLAGQAALAIDNALMFESLEKANVELIMAYDATIEGWSQALELRDQETQGHSARVLDLTLQLSAVMQLPENESQAIRRGVLLHDIGKMGIPDAILHKPGPLTDEEWEVMRRHPQYAFDMLAPIVYLRNSLDIPYCHHEKWDGTGYPRHLKGETIPLPARIFSIVDVYDALTSDRPYRKAWSKEKTIEYISGESGKHFDPRVVQAFIRLISS